MSVSRPCMRRPIRDAVVLRIRPVPRGTRTGRGRGCAAAAVATLEEVDGDAVGGQLQCDACALEASSQHRDSHGTTICEVASAWPASQGPWCLCGGDSYVLALEYSPATGLCPRG